MTLKGTKQPLWLIPSQVVNFAKIFLLLYTLHAAPFFFFKLMSQGNASFSQILSYKKTIVDAQIKSKHLNKHFKFQARVVSSND